MAFENRKVGEMWRTEKCRKTKGLQGLPFAKVNAKVSKMAPILELWQFLDTFGAIFGMDSKTGG